MKFSTDYMKLIQLLDDGLINRLDATKPAKLLERDVDKAKQVKTLLESMIEDRDMLKNSLVRLFALNLKAGLSLGNGIAQVQSSQNRIDRLNCLVMIDREAESIFALGELLTKVSVFLDENHNLRSCDDGGCA